MSEGIEQLNARTREDAAAELLKCCGSTRWAEALAGARPFRDADEIVETARSVWSNLEKEDWLEAFRAHPKIGEKKAARDTGAEARRWSEEEQSAARGATSEVLEQLAEANRAYEEKFGHIFIVCATGKSPEEMLALLRARMENDSETELRVAAEEQRRITELRLQKLLNR